MDYKYMYREDLIAEIEAYRLNAEIKINEEVDKRVAEREKEILEHENRLLAQTKKDIIDLALSEANEYEFLFCEPTRWSIFKSKARTGPNWDALYHYKGLKKALERVNK